MSVGWSSSSHAPLNKVHSVHYISGRNNANMSWIFLKSLLEYPGNLLEICSVKSVDTLIGYCKCPLLYVLCLSACLFVCLSVGRSVRLSVCLSICLFVCLSVCLFVCKTTSARRHCFATNHFALQKALLCDLPDRFQNIVDSLPCRHQSFCQS